MKVVNKGLTIPLFFKNFQRMYILISKNEIKIEPVTLLDFQNSYKTR